MTVGVAILGLLFLVLIHEAGHFFAARAVGMTPRKFYIGFGPAIVKTTRKGVEYGVGAFPLGGYVKIPGMHRTAPGDLRKSLRPDEQQALTPETDAQLTALDAAIERDDDPAALAVLQSLEPEFGKSRMYQEIDGSLSSDAYWRQKTWKRIVVIAAGPGTNFALAFVLFVVVLMIGTQLGTRQVLQLEAGMPAAAHGLRANDRIVSIAGHPIVPATVATRINATKGKAFSLVVLRAGHRVTIGPLRAKYDSTLGTYRIGFMLRTKSGPGQSLPRAVANAGRLMRSITTLNLTGFKQLATGQNTHSVSSVVGIVKTTSAAAKFSIQDFLLVLGEISFALAVINLLPVLPLDGGHIVVSIAEAIRGRAFSQEALLRYSAVGVSLFVFLLYFGLRNDLFPGH